MKMALDHIKIRQEEGKLPWMTMEDVGKLGIEVVSRAKAVGCWRRE